MKKVRSSEYKQGFVWRLSVVDIKTFEDDLCPDEVMLKASTAAATDEIGDWNGFFDTQAEADILIRNDSISITRIINLRLRPYTKLS